MAVWTDTGIPAAWSDTTFYPAGTLVDGDGVVFRADIDGDSDPVTEPDWTDPQPITDFIVEWSELQAWAAATTYLPGSWVQPTTPNGHAYSTLGGVSGATEPTWPTDASDVNDGGVTGLVDPADPVGTAVVVEFFDRTDIVTPLMTLTDGSIFAGPLFRDAENELGAVGPLVIRRDHPFAYLIETGMYVKVYVPAVGVNPVFGGFLDEGYDTVIGEAEESSEVIVRGGPGPVSILRHMRLLDDWHAPSPPASDARGSFTADGKWTWVNEPYGAILTRVIEEGQSQPGEPLSQVTIDFDRTDDTNADLWQVFTGTVEMDVGIDGLSAYNTLISTGQLYVRPEPDLTIHAYTDSAYGTDRTSTTFAAGKVRFVKGVNVLSGLDREVGDSSGLRAVRPTQASGSLGARQGGRAVGGTSVGGSARPPVSGRDTHATHALVEGKDGVYRQVVSPLYTGGPGRWSRVPYGNSDDTDLLDAVGTESLARGELARQAMVLEIVPGDDDTVGLYLPYVHLFVGDIVTVHTGTGIADFDNVDARVTGIIAVLPDATDDSTPELAIRSLRWMVELNGTPTRGGTSGSATIDCCSCNLGTPIPGTDPPAHYGEMYLGDWHNPSLEPTSYIYFLGQGGSVPLAYVPGTAIVLTGDDVEGIPVPNGGCYPGDDEIPTAGYVSLGAIPGAHEWYRIYARVSCVDQVPD